MTKVVVITGASAGVGRAAAEEFARRGCRIGLLARGQERLEKAAAELRQRHKVRVCAVAADVADAAAVERAADRIEPELGPIDIWVNNAMATVFAPVSRTTPEEFRRATEVTYLGTVHGTMTALRRIGRRRGTIVNVGSALAYRSIPLQAAYCGAKHAVVGFTDSLRSELIHDRSRIHLTMVHLAAMNTPQFDWALNKMPRRPQPVPPIFEPEVAARAIAFAAFHRRREVWVGFPTIKAILGQRIAPGLLDRYLARAAYTGQLTQEPASPAQKGNLFAPVPGDWGAHGRFDDRARDTSLEMVTSRHAGALAMGVLALGVAGLNAWLRRAPVPARR